MQPMRIASEGNQGFTLLGDSFSNRDNVRAPIQLDERDNTSILKNHFSSRMGPSIHSFALESLDRSNKAT